ncbi:13646_t:CDS:2, partial [Ambispora gerdemannii]
LVNEQAECQKVIGVKNLHAQTTKRSCSNDISITKVNLSPIDLKLKTSEKTNKVLPETGINVLPSDTKINVIALQPQAKPLVSRPPISILPDDPKEKRNHVIKMVLEKMVSLSERRGTNCTDAEWDEYCWML